MSARMFRILTALAAIIGIVLLGIYYSTLLIPKQIIDGTASPAQMVQLAIQYHDMIFLDAWLQGTGALLSVVFFVALVYLAGAATRFAGMMTMIASAVLLAVGLNEGTFTFAAAQGAAFGHPQTLLVSNDLTTVFGHVFTTVPAPFIFFSLGAVLLGSHILPRTFGYLALALGVAFEIVGFVSLFGSLSLIVNNISLVIQIGQELWTLAAAITLIIQAPKTSNATVISQPSI